MGPYPSLLRHIEPSSLLPLPFPPIFLFISTRVKQIGLSYCRHPVDGDVTSFGVSYHLDDRWQGDRGGRRQQVREGVASYDKKPPQLVPADLTERFCHRLIIADNVNDGLGKDLTCTHYQMAAKRFFLIFLYLRCPINTIHCRYIQHTCQHSKGYVSLFNAATFWLQPEVRNSDESHVETVIQYYHNGKWING